MRHKRKALGRNSWRHFLNYKQCWENLCPSNFMLKAMWMNTSLTFCRQTERLYLHFFWDWKYSTSWRARNLPHHWRQIQYIETLNWLRRKRLWDLPKATMKGVSHDTRADDLLTHLSWVSIPHDQLSLTRNGFIQPLAIAGGHVGIPHFYFAGNDGVHGWIAKNKP